MKKYIFISFATISLIACNQVSKRSTAIADVKNETPAQKTTIMTTKTAYDFELINIDGKAFSLKDYTGKKILIVNTASKCGYTPQYDGLEELYKKYQDKLVVVGFPANNFMGQEPGTNDEIKDFCKKNHGVTFPLSEKVSVVGKDAAPLFKWLVNKEENGGIDAAIKWNFTKFLIDEKGHLIANFASGIKPMDEEITSKL
jgi:glutathione peroxidase